MSSLSAAQIYARQLLLKKHGYPLWVPEPIGHSETYRTKGIRIGDVGYVTQDGAFETLFNVRAEPDAPINRRGVPNGFEQVDLDPSEITYIQNFHPPLGVPIISAEGKRQGVDVGLAVESPLPVVLDTSAQFSWTSAEGAVLHLPDGAGRVFAPLGRFKGAAQRGARSWYEFANTTLEREVANGSLLLVTGCDKTRSWMVGSFSGASSHNQVALRIGAEFIAEGRFGFTYTWDSYRSCDYRVGPSTPSSTTAPSPELTDLLELDSFFSMDAPDMQTQTVFIRGYRILLRMPLFLSINRSPIKVDIHSIHDGDTNLSLWQNNRPAPFSRAQSSSSGSWWSGRTRKAADGPELELKDEMDVELEPVPFYQTETVDLAQILNAAILQMTPSADVSLIHDDEWGALLPVLGEALDVDSVEARIKDAGVNIVVFDRCASLDLTSMETDATRHGTPHQFTHSMSASSPSQAEPTSTQGENSQETDIPNILVFGEYTKYMNQVVNMLGEEPHDDAADGTNDEGGSPFTATVSSQTINGKRFTIFNVAGFTQDDDLRDSDNDPSEDNDADSDAGSDADELSSVIKALHSLVSDLVDRGGIHLLVQVVRQSPTKKVNKINYDVFYDVFCEKEVPIVAVVAPQSQGWGPDQTGDMVFLDVVNLLPSPGDQWGELQADPIAKQKLSRLIIDNHCLDGAIPPPFADSFEYSTIEMVNALAAACHLKHKVVLEAFADTLTSSDKNREAHHMMDIARSI